MEGLKQELVKAQPNLEQITNTIVKQELEQQEKKFDTYKASIEKDVTAKTQQVVKQDKQIKDLKAAYKQLEGSISKEDLLFKQKSQNLQKNLDKIQQLYVTASQEKNSYKLNLDVNEKKLKKKEEKLAQLEKMYQKEETKSKKFKMIIQQLQQEFVKIQEQQIQQPTECANCQGAEMAAQFGNSRKTVIRGGAQRRNVVKRSSQSQAETD